MKKQVAEIATSCATIIRKLILFKNHIITSINMG
jgi:hypothetical protein